MTSYLRLKVQIYDKKITNYAYFDFVRVIFNL